MKRFHQETGSNKDIYQIRVQGRLDAHWADWFNGTTVELEASGDPPITTLTVAADQAKLRGILSKIWDLSLTVLSVILIESEDRICSEEVQNGKTSENGVA